MARLRPLAILVITGCSAATAAPVPPASDIDVVDQVEIALPALTGRRITTSMAVDTESTRAGEVITDPIGPIGDDARPEVEVETGLRWVTAHVSPDGYPPRGRPATDLETQHLRQMAEDVWAAFVTAMRAPEDESGWIDAYQHRSGFALRVAEGRRAWLTGWGLFAEGHPRVPVRVELTGPVTITDDGRAVVEYCEVDSETVLERGGAPDGGDSVYNDLVLTYHGVLGFVRTGGVWTLDDVAIDPTRTGDPC